MLSVGDPGRTYSQAPDRVEDKEVIETCSATLIEAIAILRQRDIGREVGGQKGGAGMGR